MSVVLLLGKSHFLIVCWKMFKHVW
jgi:hypothetical protein